MLRWVFPPMVKAVPDILAQIVAVKRQELQQRQPGIERAAESAISNRRNFVGALTSDPPAIIAEIKRASPSRGLLSPNFEPASIARSYEAGGAAALSVLTDRQYFQGDLADLESARAAVRLPALRKDFTIDPYHVVEAAAHGADAILLIAAILSDGELRRLREHAGQYHMAALVEVHDADELRSAIASGAQLIGVNNRDLRTFEVRLETALRLADQMPNDALRVAESGIRSSEDVQRLSAAGYSAFLVGEALMTSGDPAGALRALRS